jgi:hypothetical protein
MAFSFEKLAIYQKVVYFADTVCAATEQFPRGYGFLVDQLNRAAEKHDKPVSAASRRRSCLTNPAGRTP